MTVEKAVLLGLFSVRKLLDSHKLSNGTGEIRLRAMRYPPTGKRVTLLNNHRLDELFHMDKGVRDGVPLRFLCNQAIHSYVFGVYVNRKRMAGIYVASDKQRHKGMWAVPLVEVERAFKKAGNDYPNVALYEFDDALGDYVLKLFSRMPRHIKSLARGARRDTQRRLIPVATRDAAPRPAASPAR